LIMKYSQAHSAFKHFCNIKMFCAEVNNLP